MGQRTQTPRREQARPLQDPSLTVVPGSAQDWVFGAFRLQTSRRRLLENNRAVPIGSRALDVLEILVVHRGRAVPKQELLERVWAGRIVGDNNLTVTMSALRRALRETAGSPFIQTIPGQGYRFVAAVEPAPPEARGLAEVPSIAVLPFQTGGTGSGHDLLGEGIADAIIAALARNRWLAVIAKDSSMRLHAGTQPREAAQALGVRYVLSGSLQTAGPGVRVTAHLTDASADTAPLMWRYDREQADIFAARDEISAHITGAVRPALIEAEQRRSTLAPPVNMDAWSACQRGIWHLSRLDKLEVEEARMWFRHATELDPAFAPGFHGLALAYLYQGSGWLPGADPHWQARGEALALQAIVLDDQDSGAHAVLGFARMVRGDHRGSLTALETAAALNPNDATAWAMLGATLVFMGRSRQGLQALESSFRLSPNDPRLRIRRAHVVLAHFFSRDYGAAEAEARSMIATWPTFPASYRLLCFILAETGRMACARSALAEACRLAPAPFERFSQDRMPWYRPRDFRRVAAALQAVCDSGAVIGV